MFEFCFCENLNVFVFDPSSFCELLISAYKALFHDFSSVAQLDPSLEAKVNLEKQSVMLEEEYEVRRQMAPRGRGGEGLLHKVEVVV